MTKNVFALTNKSVSRRTFLRGAGVALSLPLLDAMTPAVAQSSKATTPRRMVAIQTNMGILPQHFFPTGTGRNYKPGPYLELLKAHRDRMTIFSGVSHPDVDGAHEAEKAFLSAAPHPGSGSWRSTISVDQLAAERLGPVTRFPSFVAAVNTEAAHGMSYTRNGVKIPTERSPAALYRQMFVQGQGDEVRKRMADLQAGRSLLDFVGESAKRIQRDVGAKDRDRLDQYFTSVRELERQLALAQAWERRPKPKVSVPEPTDIADGNQLPKRIKLMLDTIRLALETDSTRIVSLFINTSSITPAIAGVTQETHSLTHHGNRPEALDQLVRIETAQFQTLARFLTELTEIRERNESLIDRTMVLYGTCMGSANSHANTNLPVLLAGGGFRHAGHLAFDDKKNYPLANLFVSMLQRLGLENDRFASGSGTMRGLEMTT